MTYLDPVHVRSASRFRESRVAAIPDSRSGRRRAAFIAACVVALASAVLLPSRALAGWPLEGATSIALGFGATYSAADGTASTHRGIDVSAAEGSSVRSPVSGRVSFAGRVPGAGGGTVLVVTIVSDSVSLTLMPLDSAGVRAGAEIAEGDVVGLLAGAGDPSSAAPHLHVGARKGDLYLDPLSVMAVPTAPCDGATESPETGPVAQPQPAAASGAAPVQLRMQQAATPGATSLSAARAPQPAGASALSAATLGSGAPVVAAVPGASLAPGVSVAGAPNPTAVDGSTMGPVSQALSAAIGDRRADHPGEGVPGGAVVEWALGLVVRGLQTGARVLAGVLLALGALWPIWRSERRKGAVQLSVRPVSDDVAAVTGR